MSMIQEEIETQAGIYTKEKHCKGGCGNIPHCWENDIEDCCIYCIKTNEDFIAGAKWGMEHAIQWHNLRVNPDDLPNPNIAVLIYFRFEKWTTPYIAYYRPAAKKWQIYNLLEAQRQPIVDDYIDRDEVVAWCEIPTYKE